MKKTLSILSLLLFSATIFAQTVPQGINYQAVARDATGNEITNQSLIVQLSILSGSATGTVSWQETHAVSTNDYGLFTAIIGQGTSTGSGSVATFDAVDWGATTHYLKVEIDDGGGTYIDMGTTTFMSVPYALQSGDDGDWSVSGNNIHNANSGNVGIGTSSPIAELHLNGGRFLFSLDDPSYHSYINLNNTNHSLRFQTSGSAFASFNGNRTVGLGLQSSDKVGIGTNAPYEKLHIYGGSIKIDDGTNPYTLPSGDGTFNQVLKTDGAGAITWQDPVMTLDDLSDVSVLGSGAHWSLFKNGATPDGAAVTGIFTGLRNIAFGPYSLAQITNGNDNIGLGFQCLYDLTEGHYNFAAGHQSGRNITTGIHNISLGDRALFVNETGNYNIGLGREALYYATGNGNVGIGQQAGRNLYTGSFNTIIGYSTIGAGVITSGSYNVTLGMFVGVPDPSANGQFVIGHSHTKAHYLMCGDFATENEAKLGINLGGGIGNHAVPNTPTATLHVKGQGTTNSSTSFLVEDSGGNDLVTIKDDGNVGIGTSSPIAELHLNGGRFLFSLDDPSYHSYINLNNTNHSLRFQTSGSAFASFNGNRTVGLGLQSSDKVGIGTNAPNEKLHIYGGTIKIDDGTNPYTLPSGDGSSGNIMTTDGSGNISWSVPSTGTDDQNLTLIGTTLSIEDGNNVDLSPFTDDGDWTVSGNDIYNANSGNVGIGTANPVRGKLDIAGWQDCCGTTQGDFWYYLYNMPNGQYGYYNGSGNFPISVYADGRFMGSGIHIFSDERIKDIVGISNSSKDLSTLLSFEITDYKMKDKAKGDKPYKKVIAQQVREVYPQAVDLTTEVVPDIYAAADIDNGYISLKTDLIKGNKVRLIFEDETALYEVLASDKNGFKVATPKTGKVFVYGREVDDFHSVDYESISMLNVSATQELYKLISKQQETINKQNIEMADMRSEFDKRLKELEAAINTTTSID